MSTVLLPRPQLLCLAASRQNTHSKCEAGLFCRQPLYQAQSLCCPIMLVIVCCDYMSLLLVHCWPLDLFLAACNMAHASCACCAPCLSSNCAPKPLSFRLRILYIVTVFSLLQESSTSNHHSKILRAPPSFSSAKSYPVRPSWNPKSAMPTQTPGDQPGRANPTSATISDHTARQPCSVMGEGPSQNSGTSATDVSFGCLPKQMSAR